MKKRVTGIGGIFFKCRDPEMIKSWYRQHLGLQTDQYGACFEWRHSDRPDRKGFLQWCPFKEDTSYFAPSGREFMINYRVHDLEALVRTLREEGVTIVDEIETFSYGKFVHILDPEGNKIELWEPEDEVYDEIAGPRTC